MPSIAPLVDRVTPAVVNISVELKARTAAEDESDTGDESALLFRPGSTPFDQFLHRLLEQPFQLPHSAEKVQTLGSRFVIDPRGYTVTNNHVVETPTSWPRTFRPAAIGNQRQGHSRHR